MEDEKLAEKIELKEVEEEDSSFDKNRVLLAQSFVGDKYEVLAVIGQGGMGSVYKVKENATSRILALKLLKQELCKDKTARKRFLLEAESLKELDGENVVSPHDYGVTENGTPYLAMEYVEGGSLDEEIERKGKLSVDETIEIALELLKALKYAQDKKLVHRDIKPSNVMLESSTTPPKVMLADFGIAKLLNESEAKTTGLTQTGELFGTPAYMSPEQCEGGEIDYRSDFYSFGCLLYKMLTGLEPFAGGTPVQVAVKHISQAPERFAKDCPDGHPLLSMQEIIFKCMRKNKEDRYQSTEEIVEDLNLIKSGKPVGYVLDDDSKTESGVIASFKRVAIRLGTGFLGFIALCWYMSAVGMQTSLEYTDMDYFIFYFIVPGISVLGAFIYSFLKKNTLSSRLRIGDWADFFAMVSAATTFLLSCFYSLDNLSFPLSDILPIALILSIAVTICLVINRIWSFIGTMFKQLAYTGYNLFANITGKQQKTWKHRSIPVKLSTALKHLSLSTVLTTTLTLAIFPTVIPSVFSAMASLGTRYNATFAEPLMKLSVSMNKDNTESYTRLAKIQEHLGNTAGAIDTYTLTVTRYPKDMGLLKKKADFEYSVGNINTAIGDLNKILKTDPSDEDALFLRGKCFTAVAEYDKALKDLTTGIEISKSDVYSDVGKYSSARGLIYYKLGNYQKAIDDFSIAIEKKMNSPTDYVRRALAYNALGDKSQSNRNLMDAYNAYAYTADDQLAKAYAAKQLKNSYKYDQFMEEATKEGADKGDLTKAILGDLPGVKLGWE